MSVLAELWRLVTTATAIPPGSTFVLVVPPAPADSGSDTLRWVQALGPVLALAGAVWIAGRNIKNDRRMRVHDDARDALANALTACDRLVEALALDVAPSVHARHFVMRNEDRDDEDRAEGYAEAVAEIRKSNATNGKLLSEAKALVLRAGMFFDPDSVIWVLMDRVVVAAHESLLAIHEAVEIENRKDRKKAADQAGAAPEEAQEDLRVAALMFSRGELAIDEPFQGSMFDQPDGDDGEAETTEILGPSAPGD